ncbi:MAG TPA: glycine cleavage T C-terminal barrel domain-containing protein [Pirellulales bacterium]|nr:glycine cleavage T C-terminal barrel domain-containing protein [Pirellulales bacterium]
MSNDRALNEALQAAGAVVGETAFGPDVLHFGDAAGEYAALAAAAGLVDLSARTRVELRGDDRAAFLHNLCTNEIRKLPPGAGCEAFLADARGHLLFHVFVHCRPDSLLLETVPGQDERLLAHLDRYLIREKVELAGRGEATAELLVAGPRAAAALQGLADGPLPGGRLANVELKLAGRAALVAGIDLTQPGGFLLICDRADAEAIWRALVEAGVRPCGQQAFEIARIEAGFPWFGVDLSDKNLPQEAARDRQAISFVKGCYIGQETVARIDALGHVNKTLVGVKFSGASVPKAGTELTAGAQAAGQVTSACYSPRLQAPLALAWVRRGNSEPGALLDSALGRAEVVGLPATA